MEMLPLADRATAGRKLAHKLSRYANRDDVIVIALPRGGVPVAYEIALSLGAPLDVMIVRKLGLPTHEEIAMGAIASGGVHVLIDEIVRGYNISKNDIEYIVAREQQELFRREQAYRGDKPWPDLRNRCVILVDDGIATGATMRAAIQAVRAHGAAQIVIAIPLAPRDTLLEISDLVDEVICLATPNPFFAVSQGYLSFNQTSDEEVLALLTNNWH